MVYTKVQIVVGHIITYEEFEKLTGLDKESTVYSDNYNFKVNGREIYMNEYHCCSDLNDECFILGRIVKEYKRTNIKCGEHFCDEDECDCGKSGLRKNNMCGNYYVCKTCLGDTTNGYYDVSDILDNVAEVNTNYICNNCNHDNKTNIYSKQKACKECGIIPSNKQNLSDNQSYCRVYKDVSKYMRKYDKDFVPDIKFYYMLNDCLSCT
jgi:hypothetical protein